MSLSVPTYVRTSCALCRLIIYAIKAYAPTGTQQVWIEVEKEKMHWNRLHIPDRKVDLVFKTKSPNPKTPKLFRRKSLVGGAEFRFCLQVETGNTDAPATIPRCFQSLPRSTFAKSWLEPHTRWATIQSWIQDCSANHTKCNTPATPQLPSRYIDVRPLEQDGVRLVASAHGQRGSYACLSHCWGGKSLCTLNAKTYAPFMKRIPGNVLPPVFADAIATCRKLGITRLWIDSLCIQQDSKTDWLYESQKMGQYYRNCAVCIAATTSGNSTENFSIADRLPVVRSTGTDTETGHFSLIAYDSEYAKYQSHFTLTLEPHELLSKYPLLTRAWVLQERWLAPRTLHFCGREVIFECAQTTICECGKANQSLFESEAVDVSNNVRATSNQLQGLVLARTGLAQVPWNYLVSTYSGMDLTFASDRLVAISGLASTLYSHANSSTSQTKHDPNIGSSTDTRHEPTEMYLAGLWRESLARDLAWFTGKILLRMHEKEKYLDLGSNASQRKSRPQYLAPSWSWASVLDPVRYLTDANPATLFDVIDTHIELATEDPFGSVKEGCYLYLRGKIMKTSWQLRGGSQDTTACFLNDVVGTQRLDRPDSRGIYFNLDSELRIDTADQVPGTRTAKLYIFPVMTIEVSYGMFLKHEVDKYLKNKPRTTMCLVLREVTSWTDCAKMVYERVGFTEFANVNQDFSGGSDTNKYVEQDFYII